MFFSRNIRVLALLTFFLVSGPAAAEPETSAEAESETAVMDQDQNPEQDDTAGGGSLIVTSVESCLKKLPPDEASEIRLRFDKPYQECQSRLRRLEQKKNSARPEESGGDAASAEALPPEENARNFIRIQKTPRDTGFSPKGKTGDDAREEKLPDELPPAPAAKKTANPLFSYNR